MSTPFVYIVSFYFTPHYLCDMMCSNKSIRKDDIVIRLRELREASEMTQAELAAKLNVSPSTIGMYEQNRREPSVEVLKEMARIFNVTTDYLLGKEGNQNVNGAYANAETAYSLLTQMSPEQQKTAIRLLKALADENKEQ